MMVSQKEIVEALRRTAQNSHETYHHRINLANRIEAEGIAPPDGYVIVSDKPIGWHYRNKFYLKGSDEVHYCRWHECIDEADAKHYESIGCDVRAIYAPMLAAAPKGVSDEQ